MSQKNWSDADFATDINAAFVQGPNPRSRLLLVFIVLFFVSAYLWADWAVVDEVTHAAGKVIPSSQVQVIQNLEGGILKEVLIEEGGLVEVGQVVLRIDDTGHSASFGELKARYFNMLGEIERLQAESEDEPLKFSPELEQTRPELVADQRALYEARQAELRSQIAILNRQMDQRRQEKEELQSKLEQAQSSLKIAREELEITEPLVKKTIVPRVKLLQLQREINDWNGEIRTTRLALPRAESAIAEAKRRVEEKRQNFKASVWNDLSQRKSELNAVEEAITAAKDKVVRTEVRSPVKGVVKELKIQTVGGVIQPGQDLMEIVPVEDNLWVEARVRPADIAFLHPGQDATVKFTAYDFSVYGGLPGKVDRISADTIVDEQDEAFYKVIIRTEESHLAKGDDILPILPGMVASVDVISGRKTVLSYLLKPLLKAQQEALRER